MDNKSAASYLETLYLAERRISIPLKWVLFVGGLILVWGVAQAQTSFLKLLSFSLYGATNVLVSYVFLSQRKQAIPVVQGILLLSNTADVVFSSVLVYFSGGVGSELYLLYPLWALKTSLYYPLWPLLFLPIYFTGPLYVFVLYYSASSFYFLLDQSFLLRYGLILGISLLATYVGWLLSNRQRWLTQTSLSLTHTRQDLESQTELMKRTAQDLGNRLMELRSLQEGAKAINSALTLDDVLRLIVANASEVLAGARCSISLLDEQDQVVTMAASDVRPENLWHTAFPLGHGVAGWVVQRGQPALIGNIKEDDRFVKVGQEPIGSIMSVPLISDARPIGALSATSPRLQAFNSEDLGRMETFADQAALAVKNSRLYQGLSEKTTELEAILRGIGDGVIVTAPDLSLVMINPVAAQIFGLDVEKVSRRQVPDLIDNDSLTTLLEETRANESYAVKEITIPRSQTPNNAPNREMIYQGLASTIPTADGQIRGIVTVLRDVTSQKELERMKSNFLSVVSHELRTPLHSIKGFVDIILLGKTGQVNELQRDFLSTVKQQTEQLQTMISNLLESSRLEAGQVKLRIAETSMTEIAERVINKLTPLAKDNQVHLLMDMPGSMVIEGDQMRLEQVLTNLVDNAIKFTPKSGSVTIMGSDLDDRVQISVQDTGIGIPEPEQEKIFDRFYQVDSSSTRSYKGTGLGLNICRHIVERHNGRIWVESTEGEGSTFSFILPKELHQEDLSLDFTNLPGQR
jgi:PAS domain S-box-containing protein